MPEILDLRTPADWESRQGFTSSVLAKPEDLDRIIGKYDLPRAPAGSPHGTGMVRCGLNGCNELHYRGFLLKLVDGRETIIGQDCGRRNVGAIFNEIEATFKAEETRQARQQLIEEIRSTRESIVAEAEKLLPRVTAAHDRLSQFRADLSKYAAFWERLGDAARQGGRVLIAVERSDWVESSGKQDVTSGATIRHLDFLSQDTSIYARALRIQVIAWLRTDIAPDIAEAGDDLKKLKVVADKASSVRDILRDAEQFIDHVDQFFETSNLAGLLVIRDKQLRKADKSNALDRALRRQMQGGTVANS